MELNRTKDLATIIVFPLITNGAADGSYFSGTVWGALTNEALTCYSWADDGNAPDSHALTGTPTELGSTGLWYLALTQAEMNPPSDAGTDQYIIIKLSADEIDEQAILINLKPLTNLAVVDTVVDTIAIDVAGINGDAMRGTDGANTIIPNTTVPDIAGTAAVLHTITDGKVDDVDTLVDTVLTRLTSDRAGYLDKLNVSGVLANSDSANTYKADVVLLALETTAQAIKAKTDGLSSATIDTKTQEEIFEIILAMATGKFTYNSVTGAFAFFKQDNITPIFTLVMADSGRTRL